MMINTEYELDIKLKEIKATGRDMLVYGAGNVSAIILSYLKKYHINIRDVLVTEKLDNRTWHGYYLKTIDEVINENEVTVLIAVSEKNKDEIATHLEKNGFFNIITISDGCISQIELFSEKKLFFQTHIVDHCNLNCRGCYHFSSLANEKFLSLNEFERDISRLSYLFKKQMKEILLLGGEPLLHPRVKEFFVVARKYFPQGKIKILTNGLLLLKIEESFFTTLRDVEGELWVTKYPVNFDYDAAAKRALKYGVKMQYFNEEPVRTLGHQPLDLSGKRNYAENFRHCYRANQCIDLKHGKLYPCIIPAEVEPFCQYFNVDIPVSVDDGVDIYKVTNVEELLDKLKRPMPFCRFCNREAIEVFGSQPWERTQKKIEEWTV